MSNKNTEFLRAITGPKLEYNGSPITRYSTWEIGGGIKVDENPFFGKLNLSVDDQHIIDLINQHGGGGGVPTDRIESASGAAFAEATDDFLGAGVPALVAGVESNGAFAQVLAFEDPGHNDAYAAVWAGPNFEDAAGFSAIYNTAYDEYTLQAFGAPLYVEEPVESYHAATKGYVDARPGAEEWSEHAAIQDVDLDGHKLTGLGEPTNPQDAATKGYVDTAVSGSGGGGTPGHVICKVTDGDPPFEPVPQRTNLIFVPGEGSEWEAVDFEELDATVLLSPGGSRLDSYGDGEEGSGGRSYGRVTTSASGVPGAGEGEVQISTSRGYDPGIPSQDAWLRVSSSAFERGIRASTNGAYDYLQFFMGYTPSLGSRIEFTGAPVSVRSPQEPEHAATKGYVDDRLPTLEWWEPTWTPVSNVDTVTNVQCSYTRTYRAAGGSLVTLEGTIMVTPDEAGQCAVQTSLPVARVGSALLAGMALAMEATPPGHVVAVASVGSTTLTLGFVAEGADPYFVGFRISYRAA